MGGFTSSNDLRIFRDDNGVLKPLGHALNNSISMSADEIDATTKDTEQGTTETIAGTIATTVSATGYLHSDDDIGAAQLTLALQNRETWPVVIQNQDNSGNQAISYTGNLIWLTVDVNSDGPAGLCEYSAQGRFVGKPIVA